MKLVLLKDEEFPNIRFTFLPCAGCKRTRKQIFVPSLQVKLQLKIVSRLLRRLLSGL